MDSRLPIAILATAAAETAADTFTLPEGNTMDPNSAIALILTLVANDDIPAAVEIAGGLLEWMDRGGFPPEELKTAAADVESARDDAFPFGESSIVLPVGEIEYQFDGAPDDTFETVSDWTIDGNLAYATMDAAEFPVDVNALETEIDEFLSGDCPDEFVESYLECALWSSCGEDGKPLDDSFDVDDIAPETRREAETDCADFWSRHGWILSRDVRRGGFDFWLTRNRHGAGFWDGDWRTESADYGKRLTDAAHEFGGVDLYAGDDGRIHG